MRKAAIGLCVWLACMGGTQRGMAQENEPAPPGEEPTPPGEEPSGESGRRKRDVAASEETAEPAVGNAWTDIYVVPRRSVLKRHRLELMPTYNVTVNNPIVRHHGFGLQLAFYLSEAFFIGLEGTYYQKQILDRYYLLGVDQRVLPSANRYIWSAFLDVGYVPISGKFVLFGSAVLHWEAWVSAGVGVFQTEVIPRDPKDEPSKFTNIAYGALLPGFGTRLWFGRAVALDVYIKNYVFIDHTEPLDHPDTLPRETPDKAKAKPGNDSLTFDLTFGVGLSIMLPPGFEYKTLR